MKNPPPTFPPLLSGTKLSSSQNPFARAVRLSRKGKLGAGDILWSENPHTLDFALVLEPEVTVERCSEMLLAAMVAFGDAAGAICPPEVSVQYQWPSTILMNGARVGEAKLDISEDLQDGIPDWMVLGLIVHIKPERWVEDPGKQAHQTTMWDEGCGNISQSELLESVSRHLVNWIHTWSEDGFKPVYDQWWGRVFDESRLASVFEDNELMGLDENGNALIKSGEETTILSVVDGLKRMEVQ